MNIQDLNPHFQNNMKQLKTIFHFINLPTVARSEVIRLMALQNQIKLALTSKKMKYCVRYASIRKKFIEICIIQNADSIGIETDRLTIFCGKRYTISIRQEMTAKDDLNIWYDPNLSALENAVNVFQQLQSILICKSFGFKLDLSDGLISTAQLKEILQTEAFNNFEAVYITGTKVEPKLLDVIMETAHSNRDIGFEHTVEIPNDYKHENAFKFYDTIYQDARWARVEYMFSLRNSWQVALGRNNLTIDNLREYIKYWMSCDHDMVRMLRIGRINEDLISPAALFKGFVVLKTKRLGGSVYLILSTTQNSKTRPLLTVTFLRTMLRMFEFSPEDPVVRTTVDGTQERADSFSKEFRVLQVLNKIEKKEVELEELGKTGADALKMEMVGEEVSKMKKDFELRGVRKTRRGIHILSQSP